MASSTQQLKKLEHAWKEILDPHNKGIIDLDEFAASIHRANPNVAQHAIQSLFKLLNSDNANSVHGHIDENDFIQGITRNANKPAHLALLQQCLLPSSSASPAAVSHNDTPWHRVYHEHFGDLNCVNQDVWAQRMLSLNMSDIDEDDLRLFHACLDSQFRNSFDVGEFIDAFTAPSLHHRHMDRVRELIKSHLVPSASVAVNTEPLPQNSEGSDANTRKKVSREISVQTDMFDLKEQIRSALQRQQQQHIKKNDICNIDNDEDAEDTKDDKETEYDDEIEALEEHIRIEEQYLKVMDTIDVLKKQNATVFKWENALLWNEYHCINFLMDIGVVNANYVNAFESKKINGAMLLNGSLTVQLMTTEMGINQIDALLIEKSIFILRNIQSTVSISTSGSNSSKSQSPTNKHQEEMLTFYARKCEHLNRELVKLRKIEQMFKRKRREQKNNLDQLERNMYFGSLSTSHLIQKFDLDQLFQIQTAYHKTLANVHHAIQHKVNVSKPVINQQ